MPADSIDAMFGGTAEYTGMRVFFLAQPLNHLLKRPERRGFQQIADI